MLLSMVIDILLKALINFHKFNFLGIYVFNFFCIKKGNFPKKQEKEKKINQKVLQN